MKIHYVTGDATKPIPTGHKNNFILHICNDIGVWGRGFVIALAKQYPATKEEYKHWYHTMVPAVPFALGQVQILQVKKSQTLNIYVVNMIAQQGIGLQGGNVPFRSDALRECLFKFVKATEGIYDKIVHMPRIGCGLGGGKWEDVESIIQKHLCDNKVPVYVYDLPT